MNGSKNVKDFDNMTNVFIKEKISLINPRAVITVHTENPGMFKKFGVKVSFGFKRSGNISSENEEREINSSMSLSAPNRQGSKKAGIQ